MPLFKKVLNKDYKKEDYEEQFKIRVPELLAKNERIRKIYQEIPTTPKEILEELDNERKKLLEAKKKYGDYISPFKF